MRGIPRILVGGARGSRADGPTQHTRGTAMANEAQPCCPRCGCDRLTWRIKRNRSPGRDSHRALLWSCGGCGSEWTEPLSVMVEHLPGAQVAG